MVEVQPMGKPVKNGAFTLMESSAQSMIGKQAARHLAESVIGLLAVQALYLSNSFGWLFWNTESKKDGLMWAVAVRPALEHLDSLKAMNSHGQICRSGSPLPSV